MREEGISPSSISQHHLGIARQKTHDKLNVAEKKNPISLGYFPWITILSGILRSQSREGTSREVCPTHLRVSLMYVLWYPHAPACSVGIAMSNARGQARPLQAKNRNGSPAAAKVAAALTRTPTHHHPETPDALAMPALT